MKHTFSVYSAWWKMTCNIRILNSCVLLCAIVSRFFFSTHTCRFDSSSIPSVHVVLLKRMWHWESWLTAEAFRIKMQNWAQSECFILVYPSLKIHLLVSFTMHCYILQVPMFQIWVLLFFRWFLFFVRIEKITAFPKCF